MSQPTATRLWAFALFAILPTILLAEEGSDTAGISTIKPTNGPFVQVDEGFMVRYSATIPGTDIVFEMVPIPGGSFKLGSPESEDGRANDEGPQVQVTVDPMWVAKTEVNWEQYEQFMSLHYAFQDFQGNGERVVDESNRIDAVTAPTPLSQKRHLSMQPKRSRSPRASSPASSEEERGKTTWSCCEVPPE